MILLIKVYTLKFYKTEDHNNNIIIIVIASYTIPKMDRIFATHGMLCGPPFFSEEFMLGNGIPSDQTKRLTALHKGKYVTRNVSLFKKIYT